jgi:hypothetical protein
MAAAPSGRGEQKQVTALRFVVAWNLCSVARSLDQIGDFRSSVCAAKEVMRRWAETMLCCCCGADCGRLWRRVVLRKWLNVGAGSGDSDFSADEDDDEPDHQGQQLHFAISLFPPSPPVSAHGLSDWIRLVVACSCAGLDRREGILVWNTMQTTTLQPQTF